MSAPLIRKGSQPLAVDSMDLFSLPPTFIGARDQKWIEVPLQNALSDGGPLNFRLYQSRHFLNLARSYLCLKFKITLSDGSSVPDNFDIVELGDDLRPVLDADNNPVTKKVQAWTVAPTNLIGATIVKSWQLSINGKTIGDASSTNAAYRAYIESEFLMSLGCRHTQLQSAGYTYESEPGTESQGFKQRVEWVKGSQSVTTNCRIHLDLFEQDRLLIPFLDLQLSAFLNTDSFTLECHNVDDPRTFKLVLESAKLMLNEWEMDEDYSNGVERQLQSGHFVQYPIISRCLRTIFVEENRTAIPENILFSSQQPSRIWVAMVSAQNYNGNFGSSPFYFDHFNVSQLSLDCSGRIIPARQVLMDFDRHDVLQSFQTSLEAMGFARGTETNDLTPTAWIQGRTVFCFEVSPGCHSQMFELSRRGVTSLRCEFSKPTPKNGIMMIVMAEFPNLVAIDKDRMPHTDVII